MGVRRLVVNATREADWDTVEVLWQGHRDTVIASFGLHPWFLGERCEGWVRAQHSPALSLLSTHSFQNWTAPVSTHPVPLRAHPLSALFSSGREVTCVREAPNPLAASAGGAAAGAASSKPSGRCGRGRPGPFSPRPRNPPRPAVPPLTHSLVPTACLRVLPLRASTAESALSEWIVRMDRC